MQVFQGTRTTRPCKPGHPVPETRARMNDPVSSGLLPHPLLHQRLLRAEQLHGQLVVRRREDVLQLVPHPPRVARLKLTRHRISKICISEYYLLVMFKMILKGWRRGGGTFKLYDCQNSLKTGFKFIRV